MDFQGFKDRFYEQLEDFDGVELEENTNFRQLSCWDSLTAMAVLAMIDDEFSVKVSPQEFKGCNTVGELYELVKSKR